MKKNSFLSKLFRVFLLTLFVPKSVLPFWHVIGTGLALPVFGGVATAKAKGKLAIVNRVVSHVEWFLLFATLAILAVLGIWIVRIIRKNRKRRKIDGVVALLSSLQADITVLMNKSAMTKGEIKEVKESKNKISNLLVDILKNKFFVKNIGAHLHKRILNSLKLIQRNGIDLENQVIFLNQWVRRFSVLPV